MVSHYGIEIVSPQGTFCDTVQVASGAGDMQHIKIWDYYGLLSQQPVLFRPSSKAHTHVPHDV